MTRRGALVKPDPTKTDLCERPGCGDAEGAHLICGCQGRHRGKPCECPGFAVLYRCGFCGEPFLAAWRRSAHERFRSKDCRRIEAEDLAAVARGFKPRTAAL